MLYTEADRQAAIIEAATKITEGRDSCSLHQLREWMGRPYHLAADVEALATSGKLNTYRCGITDHDLRISVAG